MQLTYEINNFSTFVFFVKKKFLYNINRTQANTGEFVL